MYWARAWEWEWNEKWISFGWAELYCGWRWCNQWMFEFRMNMNAQFLHSCTRFFWKCLFAYLLFGGGGSGLFLRTSKFLRITKCCGVSGKNMNSRKNTIGSGKKIFGTRLYGKCVPAMKPNRIPMQTLSISNEPSRPRILRKWNKNIKNKYFIIFLNAQCAYHYHHHHRRCADDNKYLIKLHDVVTTTECGDCDIRFCIIRTHAFVWIWVDQSRIIATIECAFCNAQFCSLLTFDQQFRPQTVVNKCTSRHLSLRRKLDQCTNTRPYFRTKPSTKIAF